MSVARVNEFRAKDGRAEELWQLLQSVVALIKASPGCEMVRLFQQEKDPARLAIVEIWADKDAHEAAAATVPRDLVEKATDMLEFRPHGEFYRLYPA